MELSQAIKGHESIVVVDVREAEDYAKGHVPGAINLPKDKLGAIPKVCRRNRTNVVYCYSQECHLAAHARRAQFASARVSP